MKELNIIMVVLFECFRENHLVIIWREINEN